MYVCVFKREKESDWREFHMCQSIQFLLVIQALNNVWYLSGVKSSQNVMLFAEIDEGKDVIGQRGTYWWYILSYNIRMNRSRSRDDMWYVSFAFVYHAIMLWSSSQNSFFPQVRLWILLAKCSENKGFAVIWGVWKVLAALLRHFLNSVSAVSSWLEFVAEACLFCFLLSHYMLYHSALAPRPL